MHETVHASQDVRGVSRACGTDLEARELLWFRPRQLTHTCVAWGRGALGTRSMLAEFIQQRCLGYIGASSGCRAAVLARTDLTGARAVSLSLSPASGPGPASHAVFFAPQPKRICPRAGAREPLSCGCTACNGMCACTMHARDNAYVNGRLSEDVVP